MRFLLILPLLVFGLDSFAKAEDPVPKPTDPISQITQIGHNRQPLLVGDNGLVYVSRNRKEHKDPQIYYRDLVSGKERRITFQRGHIVNGIWLGKDEKIVYASSTDEEKESPAILKDYLPRFPANIDTEFFFHLTIKPSEIYSSDLKGSDIKRLSFHPGFDAFPAYSENKKSLYFSRLKNKQINIYSRKYDENKSEKAKPVMTTAGHDLGLQVSDQSNKLVWYRFSPDFNSSQLMVSDSDFSEQKLLTIDEGIHWSPSWHPNEQTVVFSAKKSKDKNYEIYEVSLEQQCQRKIASISGDEFYPIVSKDGKKVLFTSTKSGSEQIHQMAYPEPFKCEIR